MAKKMTGPHYTFINLSRCNYAVVRLAFLMHKKCWNKVSNNFYTYLKWLKNSNEVIEGKYGGELPSPNHKVKLTIQIHSPHKICVYNVTGLVHASFPDI